MCFNNTHFAILKIQGLWRELTIKRPRAKKTKMQGARNFSLLGGKGGYPLLKSDTDTVQFKQTLVLYGRLASPWVPKQTSFKSLSIKYLKLSISWGHGPPLTTSWLKMQWACDFPLSFEECHNLQKDEGMGWIDACLAGYQYKVAMPKKLLQRNKKMQCNGFYSKGRSSFFLNPISSLPLVMLILKTPSWNCSVFYLNPGFRNRCVLCLLYLAYNLEYKLNMLIAMITRV